MGYSVTRVGDSDLAGIMSFVADSVEDMNKIDTDSARPGSTCMVIDGATKVFALNTKKEWIEM